MTGVERPEDPSHFLVVRQRSTVLSDRVEQQYAFVRPNVHVRAVTV
jgi:hypothetical protein